MVGIVLQVVTLAIFGIMAVDVFFRIRKSQPEDVNPSTIAFRHSSRFKRILVAIALSYFAILIRCIYRIAEMAGGWSNPIMQNQIGFIVLDGVSVSPFEKASCRAWPGCDES